MNIAIYGKVISSSDLIYIKQLLRKLDEVKAKLSIYKPFFDFLSSKIKIHSSTPTFTKFDENFFTRSDTKKTGQSKQSGQTSKDANQKPDFLFSIGGDGTLLDTITLVRDSGIPIVGINTGRLGFLSSISKENLEFAVDEIKNGNFTLDKRTLLRLKTDNNLFGDFNYALNELTIHKQDSSSMIIIRVYVNEEYLNSYWADGLIVATSTGSTAYSLSCGGPIITPDSGNFIINPVAPHNLNVRPIVIPDNNVIKLKVEGRHERFLVSLDSRSETIDSSTELLVCKEIFKINLLRLHNQNFLTTLRNKLMWGLDIRI
ncbi:MAG: NAD kinase [Bacteroidota bacterium]